MDEMMGLAGMGMEQITVEQVVEMLKQGMTPEELVSAGVPQELVERAMMAIQQEMAPQEGLAGMGL